jgi:nucleoside-diphosphate kinase
MERTYIMAKPDAVQRGLVAEIIARFERRGYKLVAMKFVRPARAHLEEHYADLSSKGFFAGLIDYVTSGPVVAMVWEGKGAIAGGRVLLGATNPADSAPGTIRGDFCIDVGRNLIHGSDCVEAAAKEIAHWFQESELISWDKTDSTWVNE